MLGDHDVEPLDNEKSVGGVSPSSRRIISLVRKYWGVEDYLPPVDQPQLKHIAPGHKNEWEEDNQSSLLHLVGMYTPSSNTNQTTTKDIENNIPMSLTNEPLSDVRTDQMLLDQYLSTKTNPKGVKTRLSLFPAASAAMMEGSAIAGAGGAVDTMDAGYETECTLPGTISASTLRQHIKGSQAQAVKRDLAELNDPAFRSKSTEETIRTKSWNEECRWTVSFAATDDDDGDGAGMSGDVPLSSDAAFEESERPSKLIEASKELRHDTAVNSSWSQFPDTGNVAGAGSNSAPANATGASSSNSAASTPNESLLVQKLKYQIETLERELQDPSSMRDRDGMYEELRLAKRELKSLKPWYRRLLG